MNGVPGFNFHRGDTLALRIDACTDWLTLAFPRRIAVTLSGERAGGTSQVSFILALSSLAIRSCVWSACATSAVPAHAYHPYHPYHPYDAHHAYH